MLVGSSIYSSADKSRQLVDLALSAGRSLQSSVTSYIHYNDQLIDDPAYDSIPLEHNLLFVLTLFRDRTSVNINEGKKLLERLLYFQNFQLEQEVGNFPIYLHQYPTCYDRTMPAKLLPIFYWILKEFHLVLGTELREKVTKAVKELINRATSNLNERQLNFTDTLKIAASLLAFGRKWEEKPLIKTGEALYHSLCEKSKEPSFREWFSPSSIGQTFVALQLVESQISSSPWSHFWNWVQDTWHRKTLSYAGPTINEIQFGEEPEVTLYDLFLGYYGDSYSYRALLNTPVVLQGALVHTTDDALAELTYPISLDGVCDEEEWLMKHHEAFSLSTSEHEIAEHQPITPLRVVWGEQNRTHTFICPVIGQQEVTVEKTDYGIDLIFKLPEEIPSEAKQKNREIQFYIDQHDALIYTLSNDLVATTFPLNETISLKNKELILDITLSLLDGEGIFSGHIFPGNRPTQKHTAKNGRFAAYDMCVFLRTIKRSPNCTVKASIVFRK